MNKLITLSFTACVLLTSNAFGMLRCAKHAIPKRILMQKRHHIGAQPRKNIFNINIGLEPRHEINGHLEDLADRNDNIAGILHQQKKLFDQIIEILKTQNKIAIQEVFNGGSLRFTSLKSDEKKLRNLIQKYTANSVAIESKASCLEIKARNQLDE